MCVHYVADFLLQPREMGKKKSSEPKWLAGHLLIQFLCFLPFTNWRFALVNCFFHGVIDWNIWKAYKFMVGVRLKLNPNHSLLRFGFRKKFNPDHWQYQEDSKFYDTIGFDQLLHFLTLYYLSGFML
jgi:hypothetical protein